MEKQARKKKGKKKGKEERKRAIKAERRGLSRGPAPLLALGIVFLLSLTGLLLVGSPGVASADAPYRDGPLSAGAASSWLEWSSLLPPNADDFFALVCLVVLLVGFRWAGLAQRDRISR